MKQLLITTHLYTFAVICVIATTISSCTFKKKTDMETLTGTKENELTMLVGTYTSGDSKGIISQFLLTENLFIQSVNSIMNRRPPMHLPSIRKKELLNY